MKRNLLFSVLFFFTVSVLKAQQDGVLEPSFGTNGFLSITNIPGGTNSDAKSVIIQPDGKILIGGYARATIPANSTVDDRFFVTRLSSNGIVDQNFNGGAYKVFSDTANTIGLNLALLQDGSILYAGGRGPQKYAVVGKLTSSGADVYGPLGPYTSGTTYQHNITTMSYNARNDRMAVGGHIVFTSYFMLAYKFKSDGSFDQSFNGTGRINFYTMVPSQNYTTAKASLLLDDGSILLAGTSISNNGSVVVKLKPDGTFDTNFGTGNPQTGVAIFGAGYATGMTLLPNGKIMVCGTSGGNYAIYRLNANGTVDNSFAAPIVGYPGATLNLYTSMSVQPDGKILASGYSTLSGNTIGVVTRFKTDGTLDSTFATNGRLYMTGIAPNASAINTSEKTLILAGKNDATSGKITLVKIKYEVQKYNILGKDIVSVTSENKFVIHPVVTNYTYTWTYSSSDVYTLGSNTKDTLTLYFTKTTPSGTLTCVVKDQSGVIVKTATKEITVNQEPTLAQQLAPVECDPAQTYAQDNYIKSFSIRQKQVGSTATQASPSGYSDLTSSKFDTLYAGDHYQAVLSCTNNIGGPLYCGIWVDINNDGKITSEDEFLGSTVSDGLDFTVNNIVIPVNGEPGPKRMRVRVSPSEPFTVEDFCMQNEKLGETKDFLVVFAQYQGVKAPNFITPNNDGKNDNFVVRGVRDGLSNNLKIFNRVGDLVYTVDNYDNSWSGQDKSGGMLKPGTYYYVFTQSSTSQSKDDVVKGVLEIRY